jgi:hypothetical protein
MMTGKRRTPRRSPARARHEYDAVTPDEQRAAYVHQARIMHELISTLQLASDGHLPYPNDKSLLEHIQALVWSTDSLSAVRATPPSMNLDDDRSEDSLTRKEIGGIRAMVARDDEQDRRHEGK